MSTPTVALLGLGEAGSRLAADLAAVGVEVQGYDPEAGDVPGIRRASDPESAVAGSDIVLSVNTARAAVAAATSALPELRPGVLYADLNTALPDLKREVEALVADTGAQFADVALLGPVPRHGLGTPALASGPGAQSFAEALGPLGMPVEVIPGRTGDAAALKLVRSVFMKGLAASAIESLEAAEAVGGDEWLRGEIAAVIGEPFLDRLLEGSRTHAARRVDEMEAARELLEELGVEPRIASASAALLTDLAKAPAR